jgi:prolyl 4-hydroxylase
MKNTLDCPSFSTKSGHNAAATLDEYNLVVVDHVLPMAWCERIVGNALRGIWAPSTVAYGQRSRTGRKSLTLRHGEYPAWMMRCLGNLAARLQGMLDIRPQNLEPWQITRYTKGQSFDFHLDCGCWGDDASGERKRTVMLYLEAPKSGGTTLFRALNVEVRPVVGRLLVWNNLLPNGNCNHAMVHAGLPVTDGSKTILTTWERERRYAKNRES